MQSGSAVVVLLSAAVLFVVVVELTEVVVLEDVAVDVLVSDTVEVLTVVVVETVVVTQAGWSLLSAPGLPYPARELCGCKSISALSVNSCCS